MAHHLLIVDDETAVANTLARALRGDDFVLETALDGRVALERLAERRFDVVLMDVQMPGMTGLEALEVLRERGDNTPVIMMSGAGTIEVAVKALHLGAMDFLQKPFGPQRLRVTVDNALRYTQLAAAHEALRAETSAARHLIGESAPMKYLVAAIGRIAASDGRVLILGENGTGKELVATAIHQGSKRSDGPFVKLNCAAIPEDLVESELFGHEKGSFTGAIGARKGKFELAHRGTLFLDEIGDMPMSMQVKLLRVLQEGTFERVGGTRTHEVDVRVIAATNQDLAAMVDSGAFREDLYYRLDVVTLEVPPLRERGDDIGLLAAHFVAEAGTRHDRPLELSAKAVAVLQRHDFPGNVRELRNWVERVAILAVGDRIEASDVEASFPRRRSERREAGLYERGQALKDLLRAAEKTILAQALAAHGGDKPKTAAALEVERSHFYKKLRTLDVGQD